MREPLSNYDIRLEILKQCQAKFHAFEIKSTLPENLTNSLVFSYDNLKNTPELTSIFKEAVFTARELIDMTIHKLAYEHKGIISNDFTKFIIGLSNGRYTKLNTECISYLENSYIIRGFIATRIIRNKMKKELNLTFHCLNKKDLELTFLVTLPEKLRNNIEKFDEIMNVSNKNLVTDTSIIKNIDYKIFPTNFIKDLIDIFENIKRLCHTK